MSSISAEDIWKNFNFENIEEYSKESKQIVFFGFAECRYIELYSLALRQARSLNNPHIFISYRFNELINQEVTLEGRKIYKIVEKPKNFYKSALVNLIIENCKRKISGLPLIPLLFFIDIENNRYTSLTAETLTTKDKKQNHFTTHSELRRYYKILTYPNELIQKTAQETCTFVKIIRASSNEKMLAITEVNAVWEQPDWQQRWQSMQAKKPTRGSVLWQNKMVEEIANFTLMITILKTNNSKEEIIKRIGQSEISILEVDPIWLNDKHVCSAQASVQGLALQFFSLDMRDHVKVVLKAIDNNPMALKFASKRLQDKKSIVAIVARKNRLALQFASDRLKKFFKYEKIIRPI